MLLICIYRCYLYLIGGTASNRTDNKMTTLKIVRNYGLYDIYEDDKFLIQFPFLWQAKEFIAKANA